MQRLASAPRADWREKFEALGFSFHSADGGYWDESACYQFSAGEIDTIEAAAEELHRMALAAVKHIIDEKRCADLHVAPAQATLIEQSWRADAPTLYGRFDFAYDGKNPPKLLEYNADTPTAVFETAVFQWSWLEDAKERRIVPKDADQFNSLHERLIARWKEIRDHYENPVVYFACVKDNIEDLGNSEYLRDTAIQAGITTRQIAIEDIGWHDQDEQFVDLDNNPIPALFKLYPWEWIANEDFGQHLPVVNFPVIEPACAVWIT